MKGIAKTNSSLLSLSITLFFLFLYPVLFAGCANAAGKTGQTESQGDEINKSTREIQIIIKFRDNITDPSNQIFLKGLSRDARAKLSYLRPMSGVAHVFTVADVPDEEALKEIIKRLSRRPEIIYIQQDRIIRHQNNKMR